MNIKRVVPDIKSEKFDESRKFYSEFMGLELVMNMDFVMTFASPSNPTAQLSIISSDQTSTTNPDLSIEVDDVDGMYKRAVNNGLKIVYPLTDEPWGVRRFFVVDPNGIVLNVLSHL